MSALHPPRAAGRLGAAVVVAAAAALGAGWAVGLWHGPPVYDGLPLSAEPYRYLNPPPGVGTTKAPTSATNTFTGAASGTGQPIVVSTGESPPQATLVASTDAFGAAGQAVTIHIDPVAAPAPVPHGRLDGNTYRFTATGPGGAALSVQPGHSVTVALRATGAPGQPTIDFYDGTAWKATPTTHVPPSEYSTSPGQLGEFALVLPPSAGGSSGGPIGLIIGLVAGVVVIAALLFLVRRSRRPATKQPPPRPRGGGQGGRPSGSPRRPRRG
ncbi:MAG TPA: hypothetical protein VFH45_10745 [Acidimicrobiales bacterium]|nr:hypothetical protein [Acidimicrobiales bacterium]